MHPVLKTILERIALGVATLFVVSLVIFSAIELLPGDFSQVILGQAATQANMAAISRELGFCLLYTSPSPRDGLLSRMPSSA